MEHLPLLGGKCDGCDKRSIRPQKKLDAYEKETEVAIQAAIALDNAMSSGESSGSFTHEVCGGTINWVRQGPLSARASATPADGAQSHERPIMTGDNYRAFIVERHTGGKLEYLALDPVG